MALDAATLALTAQELSAALGEARIDKIHQPTRDEVVLQMRPRRVFATGEERVKAPGSLSLLLAARTGSARVCLTEAKYENPPVPPSFCMLLRKHLSGGRLLGVGCPVNERIVFFDFLCTNEMGDLVYNTLAAELMGRYCNLVLLRREGPEAPHVGGRILDALKRVDFEDSALRQLLPGLAYTLPPAREGVDLLRAPLAEWRAALAASELPAADAIGRLAAGVGPVVARELAFRAFGTAGDTPANQLDEAALSAMERALLGLRADYEAGGRPCLVRRADGRPVEFSFTALTQYGAGAELVAFEGFSRMLEGYYAEKDRAERLRQRAKSLRKNVANLYERAVRKQAARREDLAAGEQSDHLRQKGELLTANLHAFGRGDAAAVVTDWESGEEVSIPLDKRLSPSENAQKYFREYKKKQTAARMLAQLLEQGEREIEYLGSVLYEIDRAEGEAALAEIRAELKGQGYLRYYKQRDKKQKPADFLRYASSEGFAILVGRNNAQNEKLSLKTARGKDLWFHVKNAPGSHVVVMSEGKDVPLATQNEAAMLAVWHSSQQHGAKIPVDYTQVRNLRKTGDLPPGMVLYEHYETAYVTPEPEVLAALGVEGSA